MFRLTSALRQMTKAYDTRLGREFDSLIKRLVNRHNINDYEITNVQFNQKGEGFMSEICSLVLVDKKNSRKLNLVAKMTVRNEQTRKNMCIRISFKNEIYFYRVVYPVLRRFEEQTQQRSKALIPKCYTVSITDKAEGLVLENLKVSGFRTLPKREFFDHHHLNLIFRAYGRFHALSFALRAKHKDYYYRVVKGIKPAADEIRDVKSKEFAAAISHFCRKAGSTLEPGMHDHAIRNFDKYLTDPLTQYKESVMSDERHSVILHGDCWTNNILFKYQEDKVQDIRFIDWQLTKLGNPTCDLSYCLYSGASKENLDKLQSFLSAYYESFASAMRSLDCKPQHVYPYEMLMQDWKKHAKFGMIMAFFLLKIKLTDQTHVRSFAAGTSEESEVGMFLNAPCDEQELNRRLRELILHMNEIEAL